MIQLDNVSKVYKVGVERIRALDGVSLTVGENEHVAVMGPSGSGKSTLMNIVGCLDRPTSGMYRLDGKALDRMSGGALATIRNRHIGFVFQSFELLPRLNALRNVELPLIYSGESGRNRRRRARTVLERVGLGDRVKHRPNQLSGGEKQRVAIARALIVNPRVLLADEPTGNLDSKTSKGILDLVDALHAEGLTVIMVTHEESVAQRSGRVVRMIDGRIRRDLSRDEDARREGRAPGDGEGGAP